MATKDMSKVKLPAFIYSSPQTWWITCKLIFAMYKIKNATEKYNHIVVALPADVTSKLLYILSYPVEEMADNDPCLDMLRGALFQRYLSTDYECFKAFTMMKPLQPGQKLLVLCDALRASLPAHICIKEHD